MVDFLTYAEWRELPPSARKEALVNFRRNFDDKDIREYWGLKPANWYNILSKLGLSRKRGQKAENTHDDEPEKPKRERPRKVVEAEFTVITEDDEPTPEPAKQRALERLPAPAVAEEALTLPFPTFKGTPAQLRKQFEAVAMFLEALENEDTRFEIRISAVKA